MRLAFGAMFLAAFATEPLYADPTFSVRIAPDPIASPIKVFVTVTTEDGVVARRLAADDFSVTVEVDGAIQKLPLEKFQLPAAEDSEQQVSVVFAMDYSGSVSREAKTDMEGAVKAFISQMKADRDYAAVLKFNDTYDPKDWVIQPFNLASDSALIPAVELDRSGIGSPVVDAIGVALNQFGLPPQPLAGPKAVVLSSDGGDNSSESFGSDVVKKANEQGVAVFAIGVGDTSRNVRNRGITGAELMQELAGQTGGLYEEAADSASIEDLYLQVSNLLANEYLLVFPFDEVKCETTYEIKVSLEDYNFVQTWDVKSGSCPPPPRSSTSGGGAFGPLGLIAGLSLLALRRRLVVA